MTAAVTINRFVNAHLSVSRLKAYEQCARSFYYRYVDKGPVAPREVAPELGTVLHAAIERAYQWILSEQYDGPFPETELIGFYREVWQASDLTGASSALPRRLDHASRLRKKLLTLSIT